jgi:hypothetical protein
MKVAEAIKFIIFDCLTVEVKIFGTCVGGKELNRSYIRLNSTRLFKDISQNTTIARSNKKINLTNYKQNESVGELKSLISERVNRSQDGLIKEPQLKLLQQNSELFFKRN